MHGHLASIAARLRAEHLTGPINPLDPHASIDASGNRRSPLAASRSPSRSSTDINANGSQTATTVDDDARTTAAATAAAADAAWVVVGTEEDSKDPRWFELFVEFFIQGTLEGGDDLLFFVRENHDGSLGFVGSELLALPSAATGEHDPIFVRRKVGSKLPDLADVIDWKQTFFLNVIIQLPCLLTASVCKKTHPTTPHADSPSSSQPTAPQRRSKMVASRRVMKKVYSAPYKARMDAADSHMNECSFPLVFYTVNDYECDDLQMTISDNEYLCAELSVLLPTDSDGLARKIQGILRGSQSPNSIDGKVVSSPTTVRTDNISFGDQSKMDDNDTLIKEVGDNNNNDENVVEDLQSGMSPTVDTNPIPLLSSDSAELVATETVPVENDDTSIKRTTLGNTNTESNSQSVKTSTQQDTPNGPQTYFDFDGKRFEIPETDVSPFPTPPNATKIVLFQGGVSYSVLLKYYMDKDAYLDEPGVGGQYNITGYGRRLSKTAGSAITSLASNIRKGNFSTSGLANEVLGKLYDNFWHGSLIGNSNSRFQGHSKNGKSSGYYDNDGRIEYILMRGPKGKGQCQVAIKDEANFPTNRSQQQQQQQGEQSDFKPGSSRQGEIQVQTTNNSIVPNNEVGATSSTANKIVEDEDEDVEKVSITADITEASGNDNSPSAGGTMIDNSLSSKIKLLGGQLLTSAKSTVLSAGYSAGVASTSSTGGITLNQDTNGNRGGQDSLNRTRNNDSNSIKVNTTNDDLDETPRALRLSLTYVNIPWQSVVSDLLTFFNKAIDDAEIN